MLSNQNSSHIKLCFVTRDSCQKENDVNDEMKKAFQECCEADLSPEWISEKQCLSLTYTKQNVFVLQEFTGNVFNKLRSTKSVVCGPSCLRACLAEGKTIPDNNSPVYTTAMRDLNITVSNSSTQTKAKIKEQVRYMGGIYTSNLMEGTTHLISNAVRSAKYEKATERGITVMTQEWIKAVWEASLKRNIKATDAEFDVYKCKIFQGLELSCSNLGKAEKEKIKQIVTENGGKFSPQLLQKSASLLVIGSAHGDKYKHAVSWNLPCVYPSWIMESIEKGYAVPTTNHLLPVERKCSTPTSSETENITLGADQLSLIGHDVDQSRINETMLSNATVASGEITKTEVQPPNPTVACGQSTRTEMPPPNSALACGKSVKNEMQMPNSTVAYDENSKTEMQSLTLGAKYKKYLASFNITTAKKAGLFVDGCKIFLSGFTVKEVEKLRRLLCLGGATIFNELSETVSYVIIGEQVANDVKTISNFTRRPYVVSLEWLAASIKQRGPASGDVYSCLDQLNIPAEPPSPLSQKGLQLLQPSGETNDGDSEENITLKTPVPVSRKLFTDFAKPEGVVSQSVKKGEELDNKDVEHVSSNAENNTQDSEASVSQSESQMIKFFQDLTFKLLLDEDEQTKEIERLISYFGGIVVNSRFKGIPDYCVVPITGEVRHVTASEIVTPLWLEDCYENEECLKVQYYHQPVSVNSGKKPLAGCCLSSSNFSGKEKIFLTHLGEALGAMCQEVFARKINEERGIYPSTHLISAVPFGSKYQGAIKWNIPVVSKEWLLACAKNGIKMPEKSYFVTNNNDTGGDDMKNNITTNSNDSKNKLIEFPNCSKTSVEPSPNRLNVNQSPLNLPKSSDSSKSNLGHFSVAPSTPVSVAPLPPDSVKSSCNRSAKHAVNGLENSFGPNICKLSPVDSPNIENLRVERLKGPPNKITPCKRPSSELDSDVSPFHIDTPDTPYGQAFGTPTKSSKKRWKKFIDNIGRISKPESPPPKPRRESTPMSELRARVWERILESPGENSSIPEDKQNASVSSPKIRRVQSVSPVTEAFPTSSNGTMDRVAQHLEKLVEQIANHTPPVDRIKRRSDPNTLQPPVSIHLNPSTSKQNAKAGLIDSQPITIDWEDPIEAAERSKINKMKILNEKAKPVIRKFVIGSDLKDHSMFAEIITDLGGEVISDTSTFDPSTTHIIVENPVRSEKLLCCLAAGKWILHSNYLVDCKKHKKWLDEEDYECGNPRSINNIPEFRSGNAEIAKAAYRWRTELKNGKGAFYGMKIAVMNISASKKGPFERFIRAGNGILIDEMHLDEATFCCMDPWTGAMPDFVKELVENKIPCVKPVFLGEYLYKEPKPSLKQHILPKLKDSYCDKDLCILDDLPGKN